MKTCHACKRELSIEKKIGRRGECVFCGADLHCCLNCTFYNRSAAKQCREPVAEAVREKEKANFCGYFVFKESGAREASDSAAEQARKTLGDLFKK